MNLCFCFRGIIPPNGGLIVSNFDFETQGCDLRVKAKKLTLDFMRSKSSEYESGFRTADIFNSCGFNWGDYDSTKSTQQQYWVVAVLRELERDGEVKRLHNKRWVLL